MSGESYLTKIIQPLAVETVLLPIPAAIQNRTKLMVLRLDQLHPVISGNKFFKLKYPVLHATETGKRGIVSFGGAWSNHLVALACMAGESGLASIGLIRGEKPPVLSQTLLDAIAFGMELKFISREKYADKKKLLVQVGRDYPDHLIIPEGGQSAEGVTGASEILQYGDSRGFDHIVCAMGTGTMLAGMLRASGESQAVLGISSLKLSPGNDIERFVSDMAPGRSFSVNYNFHFGGYAKKTNGLIDFMNLLWDKYQLPTDFVYTAKMIYGIDQLLQQGYFKPGSSILAIHSGGLQGNRSIAGQLRFAG